MPTLLRIINLIFLSFKIKQNLSFWPYFLEIETPGT
jgi:hypothetical protein